MQLFLGHSLQGDVGAPELGDHAIDAHLPFTLLLPLVPQPLLAERRQLTNDALCHSQTLMLCEAASASGDYHLDV